MGYAVIVANKGEGLYQVKLKYNQTYLQRELDELNALEDAYWKIVLEALRTLDRLREEKETARVGMNKVLQQYLDGLISKANETLPPLPPATPTDPEGHPWPDPDRSWDSELATAINDARTANGKATLSTNSQLSWSALLHANYLSVFPSASAFGTNGITPEGQALAAGYSYDAAVGVDMVLGFAENDPDSIVATWLARWNDARNTLLGTAYENLGVAFKYAPDNPYHYIWVAVFSKPGTPPEIVTETEPAKKAAENAEKQLKKIELPDKEQPKKLSEVCGIFAKAAQKLTAGEKAIAQLKIESMERQRRIALLENLKTQGDTIYDAWACQYIDIFLAGDIVLCAEVPGYWNDAGTGTSTTMGVRNDPDHIEPDRDVSYTERSINLIPNAPARSYLNWTETMTPAAAYYAAAIEPGHLKWKPVWRYGKITAITGDTCSIELLKIEKARKADNESDIEIDRPEDTVLTNVPVSYPPCDISIFRVDDEVLILFEGFDRSKPKVIGFKKEPRPCPQGRVSWRQLSL